MRTLIAALLLCTIATGAWAQNTFTVVNFGLTAYQINGVNNPTLALTRGQTYTFNVNAIGHPFYVKTDRVIGTASQYTNGVTGRA